MSHDIAVQRRFVALAGSPNPRCAACKRQWLVIDAQRKGMALARRGLGAMALHGALPSEQQRIWTAWVEVEMERLFDESWQAVHGLVTPPPFAFCVCGSLGRYEASPYSDVDAFALVEETATDVDVQALTRVFRRIQQQMLAVEQGGMRFCDGGLSPASGDPLIKSPTELIEFIETEKSINGHLTGAYESRYVFGAGPPLFHAFGGQVDATVGVGETADTALLAMGRFLATRAEHPAPTEQTAQFNVKEALYRPLQMSLALLCKFHGLKGALASRERLRMLRLGGATGRPLMSAPFVNLYLNALEDISGLRIANHLQEKMEADTLRLALRPGSREREAALRAGRAVDAVWAALENFHLTAGKSPSAFMSDTPFIPPWTPDSKGRCEVCNKSVMRGFRHHCRRCGKLVCGGCSKGRGALVPGSGGDWALVVEKAPGAERLCDPCAARARPIWSWVPPGMRRP